MTVSEIKKLLVNLNDQDEVVVYHRGTYYGFRPDLGFAKFDAPSTARTYSGSFTPEGNTPTGSRPNVLRLKIL